MLRELERRLAVGDVSDEQLMAFIDGELDEAESAEIADALAADRSLRERAEKFRATRAAVQQAFDAVLREPVPEHLIALVRAAPQPNGHLQAASQALRIISFDARTARTARPGGGPQRTPKPLRMAAAVALLVLVGAGGWALRPLFQPGLGDQQAKTGEPSSSWASVLQAALESEPSGARVPVGRAGRAEGSVEVVSTFRSYDQRYCRQYAVRLDGSETFDGLACRTAQAGWLVEHQLRRLSQPKEGLKPAAGSARQALDVAVDDLIDGGLLDPAEERKLLASRWTASLRDR